MSSLRQWVTECETAIGGRWASANSTTSRAHDQADNRQCSSEATLLDRDWFTTEVVDSLADRQQDWIGMLQDDWRLELYSLDSLGIQEEQGTSKHSCLSVADLVSLIHKMRYEPLTLAYQQHWGYTCCLQIAGLGRVRLVVYFNNSQCFGQHTVLVTNRLDWSPRRILAQWLQHRSATNLYSRNPAFKFHPQGSLQLA